VETHFETHTLSIGQCLLLAVKANLSDKDYGTIAKIFSGLGLQVLRGKNVVADLRRSEEAAIKKCLNVQQTAKTSGAEADLISSFHSFAEKAKYNLDSPVPEMPIEKEIVEEEVTLKLMENSDSYTISVYVPVSSPVQDAVEPPPPSTFSSLDTTSPSVTTLSFSSNEDSDSPSSSQRTSHSSARTAANPSVRIRSQKGTKILHIQSGKQQRSRNPSSASHNNKTRRMAVKKFQSSITSSSPITPENIRFISVRCKGRRIRIRIAADGRPGLKKLSEFKVGWMLADPDKIRPMLGCSDDLFKQIRQTVFSLIVCESKERREELAPVLKKLALEILALRQHGIPRAGPSHSSNSNDGNSQSSTADSSGPQSGSGSSPPPSADAQQLCDGCGSSSCNNGNSDCTSSPQEPPAAAPLENIPVDSSCNTGNSGCPSSPQEPSAVAPLENIPVEFIYCFDLKLMWQLTNLADFSCPFCTITRETRLSAKGAEPRTEYPEALLPMTPWEFVPCVLHMMIRMACHFAEILVFSSYDWELWYKRVESAFHYVGISIEVCIIQYCSYCLISY
jgi:hypothetical protein